MILVAQLSPPVLKSVVFFSAKKQNIKNLQVKVDSALKSDLKLD